MVIWRTAVGLVIAATRMELFLTTLALAAALLLAALIIKWVDRWRKQPDDLVQSPEDQLVHFERLRWKGELSKEEFERIQALLGERIRQGQARPDELGGSPPHQEPGEPPGPPETGIQPQPPG